MTMGRDQCMFCWISVANTTALSRFYIEMLFVYDIV